MKSAAFVLIAASIVVAGLPPAAQAASGRVVVIVMENQKYSDIVGSSDAAYINSLISAGKLFTDYDAVINGSLHNYLAMTSGVTAKLSPPSANVFQAIDATGGSVTWTEFEESMSGYCGRGTTGRVPGRSDPLYTESHDPAFKMQKNESCTKHDIPMTTSTFNPSSLPSLSFIVPNQCDDMHTPTEKGLTCPAYFGPNGGSNSVKMGDNWLSVVVPQLLAQPDITVLLTWDEGQLKSGEHIVTVEVGAGITPGTTDGTAYDHYGLEAGLYGLFGLGIPPNHGATATPLPIP